MQSNLETYIVFLVSNLNPDLSSNSVIFSWSSLQREPLVDSVVVDEFWPKFSESQEALLFDRAVIDLKNQRRFLIHDIAVRVSTRSSALEVAIDENEKKLTSKPRVSK